MKNCIACGMPMKEASEFAMNDMNKEFCVHCSRPDGTMQSFDEKRENLADFIVKTQGFDKIVALEMAESMMKNLPAWAEHFS